MSNLKADPVHGSTTFEDLSGISTADFSNPYDALISLCEDDPTQIQLKYNTHRTARNAQQKSKLQDDSFPGVNIDSILLKLTDTTIEPGFADPRHCLVVWGRPTTSVKALIARVQKELMTVAPNLWVMPQDNLHITVLEVTHSKTADVIQELVDQIKPHAQKITDYTYNHRSRLIKPLIGYDASALALSFVPAAGEGLHGGRTQEDDKYTYHHLRRDVFALCKDAGVEVDSRYVVPSSHLTIGRFIDTKDFSKDDGSPNPAKMKAFVEKIEEINKWLQGEFWPEHNEGTIPEGGEFNVGEETGLHCRMGMLWYGGGEQVARGKGY